jgi:hypothetical protein
VEMQWTSARMPAQPAAAMVLIKCTRSGALGSSMQREPLFCRSPFRDEFVTQCEELGALVAASLDTAII